MTLLIPSLRPYKKFIQAVIALEPDGPLYSPKVLRDLADDHGVSYTLAPAILFLAGFHVETLGEDVDGVWRESLAGNPNCRQGSLVHPTSRKKRWWNRMRIRFSIFKKTQIGNILGVILVMALKIMAKGKMAISMIVMVATYAWFLGLPFALGFVGLLFIHEMGHVLVLKRLGVPCSTPMFIPFVGALISMERPKTAWDESLVGIGGPLIGGAAAISLLGLAAVFESPLLQALAYTGCLLNLFNLIPAVPLDGGRVVQVFSKWVLLGGFLVGIGMTPFVSGPMLEIILLLGVLEVIDSFSPKKKEANAARRAGVTKGQRVLMGLVYAALVGLLILGMDVSFLSEEDMAPIVKTTEG